VTQPITSCKPLAFSVGSRSSECFGRFNTRGFLSSPLVVVGKGLADPQSLDRSWFGQREARSLLSLGIPCLVVRSAENVIEPSRCSLGRGVFTPEQPLIAHEQANNVRVTPGEFKGGRDLTLVSGPQLQWY
jgi:hypothetical protein